jgi:hypothetical protein
VRQAFAAAFCLLVFTTNGDPLRGPEPDLARLPRCEMKALPSTRRWTRFTVPENGTRLRIPPEFAAAPPPAAAHGGFAWRDGGRELRALFGHWSLHSFQGQHRRCLMRTRRMDAVIIEREQSTSAWLVDSGYRNRWRYDLLLTIDSAEPADRELFAAIVRSAERPR